MTLTELAGRVGLTLANLSILKNGRSRANRATCCGYAYQGDLGGRRHQRPAPSAPRPARVSLWCRLAERRGEP